MGDGVVSAGRSRRPHTREVGEPEDEHEDPGALGPRHRTVAVRATGAVLIVTAWTSSLRARPATLGGRRAGPPN